MSLTLSSKMEYLADSLPLLISARAKQMIAEGIDVTNLSVGEPDFPSPANVKEAGIDAIRNNFTKYTPAAGIPDLRKAVSGTLKKDHNLEYSPDQIVITNGAKQAIASTLIALLNPGDEVIYPYPCYASYVDLCNIAGGKPVGLETTQDTGFRINPEQLSNLINNRTKAIIINSPNNPTGAAYSLEEMKELSELLAKHDIWLISDEIYGKLRYDGEPALSFASLPGLYEKTALINGVSKAFSMTGWRIGFLAAPVVLAKAVASVQSQVTGSPGSISQKAALEAYTGDLSETERMKDAFSQRKELITKLLRDIPGISFIEPEGAFYVFPEVSGYFGRVAGDNTIRNSMDLCQYLLEDYHLALVPGSAFGADKHIRFSFAASEENIRIGVSKFTAGLANFQ
ncbi:MAG: pyridoxal phosphate-dependent aminotransferase [Candidatus Electryonea clarkiae]|nr:pyridoxal phosphate-dependent aminotransferase [Candidatus Electryonea clarkiae]MDP8289053.1 pyridoxal phosphate-dependent aminotransferase [Candidatus Electryonea clarkiae]